MEDTNIWTTTDVPALNAGICSARSIRRLRYLEWWDDELLDTVPVVGVHTFTKTYLLPSRFYQQAQIKEFDKLTQWLKRFAPNGARQWVLDCCESFHWKAVKIDWDAKIIYGYDPYEQKLSDQMRRTLRVRTVAAHLQCKTNIEQRLSWNWLERSNTNLITGSLHSLKAPTDPMIKITVASLLPGFRENGY